MRTEYVVDLEHGLNDLASLLALPAMWAGRDAGGVTATLLEVLVRLLQLDFAYLERAEPDDPLCSEWVRSGDGSDLDARAVGRALRPYLARYGTAQRVVTPPGGHAVSIVAYPLGSAGEIGVCVAGTARSDFPTRLERLLLQVATNQASLALQAANRQRERQHAHEALERRVAERTVELTTLNQALCREVEQRRRTAAALAESEDRLTRMADSIPEVIWIASAIPEERLLYVSPSFERVWGLPVDALYQNPRLWTATIHADDRDRVVRAFSRWVAGTEASYQDVEYRIVQPDGSVRWIFERGVRALDEHGRTARVSGISTDVTERKRAEETLKQAFEEIQRLKDRLQHENIALREEVEKTSMFEEIVGVSPALRSVLAHLSKVAPTDSTVLITGETGTGKELVARAIHKRSRRSARAFVSVNCAATPASLIASELFGHEKGAFTGATQRRQGRFELAEGGTIFLDEVGELPAETQVALLRVLQEREFERVGGSRTLRADVRVIAATNRDLETAVAERTFRADLYYRLNVFPIAVPALRDRREDVPVLLDYFLHRYAQRAGKNIQGIARRTLERLQSYHWPGNIRELQNVVERAVIVCDSDVLHVDERWFTPRASGPAPLTPPANALATNERTVIEAALRDSKARVAGPFGAAARLGVPATTLESKIKALGIDKRRFKTS